MFEQLLMTPLQPWFNKLVYSYDQTIKIINVNNEKGLTNKKQLNAQKLI